MNKTFIVGTRLDAEDHAFLVQIAEREERPISDVLRRIVRQVKQRADSADQQQVGAFV